MGKVQDDDTRSLFAMFYRAQYLPAVSLTRWRAPEADAEALVAEAFLTLWQHVHTGGQISKAWFFKTLRNKIGDYYRSSQRREIVTQDYETLGLYLAEAGREDGLLQRLAIYDLLNKLPMQHAEVLALIYGCDLTTGEAARVLGIRDAALRKRLERARAAFAELVAAAEQTPSERQLS